MHLTNRNTVRQLCEKYGFSLSKGFGQNFLVNPGVCPKICDAAGIEKTDNVLEIGPGFGTLTQQLAQRANKVLALEIDKRLLPVLEETLQNYPNVLVQNGDVMKENLAKIIEAELGGRAKVCANLPYNLTSPILMRLLEERLPITNITVMVQKEAALRITAAPGTRGAGAITYAVHYYAKPKLQFCVSAGSFTPAPKVKSAVISLEMRKELALAQQPKRQVRLFSLVRASFSQRRKTLANAAAAGLYLPKDEIIAALKAANLQVDIRPEQLSLEDYIRLEECIWADPF